MSQALYFLISKNFHTEEEEEEYHVLNDKNPIFRNRNEINLENRPSYSQNAVSDNRFYPYPSSFLPDFFFKNTVRHPFLIFLNLYSLFDETKDGDIYSENNSDKQMSIIKQLNDYYGVEDILSISQLKIDSKQVSKTWNERFPEAKSSLFTPVHNNFIVSDVSHLQSIHLLGFTLNVSFYLIFFLGKDKIFNLKLGPDNSENDIHFKVFCNVDKSRYLLQIGNEANNSRNTITQYKHEKWLTFQRIEVGSFSSTPLNLNPFGLSRRDKNGKCLFLKLDKREAIPIIRLPFLQIDKFSKIYLRLSNRATNHSKLAFTCEKKNIIIGIRKNEKDFLKLSKIKSIVTNDSKDKLSLPDEIFAKDSSNIIPNSEDDIIIAETNDTAFFVIKNEVDLSDESDINDIMYNNNISFGGTFTADLIKEHIISFADRLNHPLKYHDIYASNHPLIDAICYYNLYNVMMSSTDYIDDIIGRNTNDRGFKIRIVPVNDGETFISYQLYDLNQNIAYYNAQFKDFVDKYPQVMSIGQDDSHDENQVGEEYKKEGRYDKDPIYNDFLLHAIDIKLPFIKLSRGIYQPICKLSIDQYLNSKIGLNPIICPVIYKEYMEMSKTSCIYYFSNQIYDKPVNPNLMRDVQSISEFLARTTVQLFSNINDVEANANNGAFPVKVEVLKKKLENKGNQQIPDPQYDFKSPKQLIEALAKKKEKFESNDPKFCYSFHQIDEGQINPLSLFTISSKYDLSYIYVSENNIFAISQIINEYEDHSFIYGHCQAMDTEITFQNKIIGEFIAAVYMEEDFCLIICYYDHNNRVHFTGYDIFGQIKDVTFPGIEVSSLVVISRTYFASFGGDFDHINRNNDGVCVFKYNAIERVVEYNKFADLWRIKEKKNCKELLKDKANGDICFIGSQFNSRGNDQSSICVYKYDAKNKKFQKTTQKNKLAKFNMNFHLNFDESNSADQKDNDDSLLDQRIKSNSDYIPIKSMLTCVPTKKQKNFELYHLHCSLAELFPSPVIIKGCVVYCDNKDNLSLYHCDHKIYRILSHQIWGFYVNTLARISLFTTEMLLCNYNFEKTRIVLIIDNCGIGPRFANLSFGTRFDSNSILEGDIWSGCSYSYDISSIILLFSVKDIENIRKALEIMENELKPKVNLFSCQFNGVRYTIKFGNDPKTITNDSNSNEINFVSDDELMKMIPDYITKCLDGQSTCRDVSNAISNAKKIVAQYLTCGTFAHYPFATIKKYSNSSNRENCPLQMLFED